MKAGQRTQELLVTFLRAAVAGLAGGLLCVGFKAAAGWVQGLTGFGSDVDTVVEGARSLPWTTLLVLPAAGMLAAAAVARWLVPRGPGAGFADIMEAVSVKRGGVSLRSAASRSLASLCVISTGGSIGREGPIISLAAAASSPIARLFRVPPRDRALLLGCGVAAGFASAYNAPVAGAIFALEVVLGNFAVEMFAPVVVASVASTLVTRLIEGGSRPVYDVPKFQFESMAEIAPYLALGVTAGFVAVGFQKAMSGAGRVASGLPLPRWAVMTLAGLAMGLLAIPFPEICGNGYAAVSEILLRTSPRIAGAEWYELAAIFLSLAAVKTLGTALVVGGGASGGVFTPSLFVGAALGAAVGAVVNHFAPHAAGDYGGYALVGMGCMVAGTTRAPIMAIMVLYEMTLNWDIVLPLMLGCITSSLVARSLYRHSVYEEDLAARGRSAPQGIEETVLATTRVEDVMRTNPTWVARTASYAEVIPLITASRATAVYVTGDDGTYLGMIRIHDVIQLASLGDLGPGIIALDLATRVEPVTVEHTLTQVFDAMELHEQDELPVVDPATRRLVGCVARRDVMSALHVEVLQRQNLRAKFVRRDEGGAAHTDYVALPKGVEIARVEPRPEHVGRTLGEAAIRATWKLTVLFVVRPDGEGGEMRIFPEASMVLQADDAFIVLGEREDLQRWRGETPGADPSIAGPESA